MRQCCGDNKSLEWGVKRRNFFREDGLSSLVKRQLHTALHEKEGIGAEKLNHKRENSINSSLRVWGN